MRLHPSQRRRGAPGFTLLEIILAMFVLVLLVGGVFAIVSGTTQLADEMERAHERDARLQSFAQFCENTLRTLPATAQVRLRVKQEGNHYLGELALKNAPSPVGSTGANGLTILRTEQSSDGYLRVVLEMLTNEEAEAAELGKGAANKQRLVLLENVAKCEWKFFNPLSNEWEPVWNEKLSFGPLKPIELGGVRLTLTATPNQPPAPAVIGSTGKRPGLVELNLTIGADAPRRFVFWVPPASPPTVFAGGSSPPPSPEVPVPPDGSPTQGTSPSPPALNVPR